MILFGKFRILGKFNFFTLTFIDCIFPTSNSFNLDIFDLSVSE